MHDLAETIQERPAWGRGVLASYENVTPNREVRSTDVQRLSFPLQVFVASIVGAVTIYGTVQGATWGLRSDVRDILTRMQFQDKLTESQRALQDERLKILSDTVQDLKRRVELMQYEVQNQSKGREK